MSEDIDIAKASIQSADKPKTSIKAAKTAISQSSVSLLDPSKDLDQDFAQIDFKNPGFFDEDTTKSIIQSVNKITQQQKYGDELSPYERQQVIGNLSTHFDFFRSALIGNKLSASGVLGMLKDIQNANLTAKLTQQADLLHNGFISHYLEEMKKAPEWFNTQNINPGKAAFIISQAFKSRDSYQRSLANFLLFKAMDKWGVDTQKMIFAWRRSSTNSFDRLDIVKNNLPAGIWLEKERPGIIKVLLEEFGIKNFGRYPLQLLIRQFDERNNQTKPFGVILYPESDRNGAFLQNREVFEQVFDQISNSYSIRVLEAQSKYDIARLLINLKRRYGAAHKISFAIIGGHGTEDSIRFGGNDYSHLLKIDDLKGRGVQKAGEFFESDPTIILCSCATGAEGGIGQKLSGMMGAKVIAPQVPTNMKSIDIYFDQNGSPTFNVKYLVLDSTRTYIAGLASNSEDK